jgi:SulP family sulfate permease
MPVLLTAFTATLFIELDFAIFAGILLSLIVYLIRTAHPRFVNLAPNKNTSGPILSRAQEECMQFKIVRIDGSLFFGSLHHVQNFLYEIDKKSTYKRHVLIIASGINFIDVAGGEMLANESRRRRSLRGGLYLCELKREVRDFLQGGGYMDMIGNDHVYTSESEAIAKIFSQLDTSQCRHCRDPLFQECNMHGVLK